MQFRLMARPKLLAAILRPLFAVFALHLFGQPAFAQENVERVETSGGDITRPSQRFDFRFERESKPDERTTKLTLRYDHPVLLSHRWRLNLRMDVPFAWVNHRGEHDEEHADTSGISDVLLHAVLAHYVKENEGLAFGSELIIPTAANESLGKGKWRLRPMAGYRWSLSQLGEDGFFQLIARYDFSFAGKDSRSKVSELQFAPNVEIDLGHSAYLSFYPSADIRYDLVRDKLFVPVDIEVGKSFGRLVMSLEVAKAIVHEDHAPYDWRAEGRIGMRF